MGSKTSRGGKVYLLLFFDDAIFLAENEIFDEVFLAMIFFLLIIIGRPLGEEKFWAKDDLVWIGFSLNITERENVGFSK